MLSYKSTTDSWCPLHHPPLPPPFSFCPTVISACFSDHSLRVGDGLLDVKFPVQLYGSHHIPAPSISKRFTQFILSHGNLGVLSPATGTVVKEVFANLKIKTGLSLPCASSYSVPLYTSGPSKRLLASLSCGVLDSDSLGWNPSSPAV